MTAAEEWRALAAQVHDLPTEAFFLALRCYENGGVGKAVHLGELIERARKLTDAMHAFAVRPRSRERRA